MACRLAWLRGRVQVRTQLALQARCTPQHPISFHSDLCLCSCILQSTSQYLAPCQVSSPLSTCFPKDCHFCCPLTDSLWLSGSIWVIIKILSAYWGTLRADVVSYNFLVPQQTFRKRLVLNILLIIYFGISQIDLKSWCCSFWVNVTELPLGILALLDITWLYCLLGFLPLLWLVLLGFPWDRCLCVLQHPNASGLGSAASSLVTCCLAELPPFGFNHHPLADNSKSSQELCLHPGPVSTRAASVPGPLNFPYARWNSSFPPSHLP